MTASENDSASHSGSSSSCGNSQLLNADTRVSPPPDSSLAAEPAGAESTGGAACRRKTKTGHAAATGGACSGALRIAEAEAASTRRMKRTCARSTASCAAYAGSCAGARRRKRATISASEMVECA